MNNEQFRRWLQSRSLFSELPAHSCKPLIMGIVNVTPDSFSDGGQFLDVDGAFQHAMDLVAFGADVIDIGGESSKPGAIGVSTALELERILPVIERIRAVSDVCISIDTCKAEVMEAAVSVGASFINDIRALREPNALAVARELNVPICLMHMQGVPSSMQVEPYYSKDIVEEISHFFQQRIDACVDAGIPREHLILDPGFGYGKTVHHNLVLLRSLSEFRQHRLPILLGASRKSTIGILLNKDASDRLVGGLAITVYAALQGVSMIRTHDVDETSQALKMVHAIVGDSLGERS